MYGRQNKTPALYRGSSEWVPTESLPPGADSFWGPPEDTPALEAAAAKDKAAKRTRLLKGPPRAHIAKLNPQIINYEPRNLADADILGEIAELQALPRSITVTAKKSEAPSTTDDKRRQFENLQRQLRHELQTAEEIGTFDHMDDDLRNYALEWASRDIKPWEDIDSELVKMEVLERELNDVEPRVRKIVRELIERRVMSQWQNEDEEYCAKYGDDLPGESESEAEEALHENDDQLSEEEAFGLEDQKSDGNNDEEFARLFVNFAR